MIVGFPYMTSEQKGGAGKKYPKFVDKQILGTKRGEGVKRSEKFVDVVYGTPLA